MLMLCCYCGKKIGVEQNSFVVLYVYFQGENIILIDFDMLNRIIRDYDGSQVVFKIQAVFDVVLMDEEDIDIEGG